MTLVRSLPLIGALAFSSACWTFGCSSEEDSDSGDGDGDGDTGDGDGVGDGDSGDGDGDSGDGDGDGDGSGGTNSSGGAAGDGDGDASGGSSLGGGGGGGNSTTMIDCHDLDYATTCNDTMIRTGGYYACSDYFGDILGVEVQCEAGGDSVEVGPDPCQEYEFPVGTCVYYNDALPDRCYATHVGSSTAEGVEAGQAFWSAVCPDWRPAD